MESNKKAKNHLTQTSLLLLPPALNQAVHFKDHAIIFATSHGLKVIVEEAKSMQGNAFLQASLFNPYQLTEEQVRVTDNR